MVRSYFTTTYGSNFYIFKTYPPFMKQLFFISTLLLSSLFTLAQVVDGGNGHAVILDKNGSVWTVGRNNYGQLGDSTLQNSPRPKKIGKLRDIAAISRGYDHSIALDKQGNLYLWGRNNYGQLGSQSANDQSTPQKLAGHTNFTAIEGGYWHTVGLKKNGTVWAWGHNYYAELGNGTREHSPWPVGVLQITASGISELKKVTSIASVGYHTLALKEDGTVWGWGGNSFNELGKKGNEFQQYAIKIDGIPKIKEIAVGWHHSVALDYDGRLWIWGSDPAFQFKEETKKLYDHPTLLKHLPKFTKIACGSWHSLAIDENQNVWGWGKNHFGMLGTGDTISHSSPILIKPLKNIVDIGGGCFQSIAVDSKGNIFSFGDNPSGQQGIGNYSRCYTPKLMALSINGIEENANLYSTELITIPLQIRTDSELINSDFSVNHVSENPLPQKAAHHFIPSEAGFDNELIVKGIKYLVFAISILFNIVLYRRWRKATHSRDASI